MCELCLNSLWNVSYIDLTITVRFTVRFRVNTGNQTLETRICRCVSPMCHRRRGFVDLRFPRGFLSQIKQLISCMSAHINIIQVQKQETYIQRQMHQHWRHIYTDRCINIGDIYIQMTCSDDHTSSSHPHAQYIIQQVSFHPVQLLIYKPKDLLK